MLRGARGGVGIALKMKDGGPYGVREVTVAEALRRLGALDDPRFGNPAGRWGRRSARAVFSLAA